MKAFSIFKNKNVFALALSLAIIAGTYGVVTNFTLFKTESAFGASGGNGNGNGSNTTSGTVINDGGTGVNAVSSGGSGGNGTVGGGTVGDGSNGNGGSGGDLCGWAWGATNQTPSPKMGVGWISVNSKDCDTDGNGTISSAEAAANVGCPAGFTGTYKLSVDSDRYITGYAWSSNLGWLKFGGLNGMPTTAGNDQQNARVSSNSGGQATDVKGWARFCAGTAGGNCSSMTGRDDGWDGWLSLFGSNYGLTYDPNNNGQRTFQGYSWGGPVVGWVRWDQTNGRGVRYCIDPVLGAGLTANPSHGNAPLRPTLTASYQLTAAQRQLAQSQVPSYRFRCDYTAAWSASQSSNTYTGCTYNTPSTYFHPQAEITVGSQVSIGTAEVYVEPVATPNDLGASCDVEPERIALNATATWTVELTETGVPPYTYTVTFDDGQPNPSPIVSSQQEIQIPRLHTTLGNKTMTVRVTDSRAVPGPATGRCTANAQVVVNPTIIEI